MTEEHPTIPQIVRALTTLKDRQNDTLKAMQAEHEEKMGALKGRFDSVDSALLGRDLMVEELERVIGTLCKRIERTQEQLKRDNQQCVYSEPLELINLLGSPHDASVLIRHARQRAHEAKNLELARQRDNTPKKCACGLTEEPFSKRHTTGQCAPAVTVCQCGKRWVDEIPAGHNLSRCFYPCRVCGHEEDRHTEELPEEGGNNFCQDCSGTSPFPAGDHTFDGAISALWDRCKCGHVRSEHLSHGPGGAYCKVCVQGHGKQHTFALK